LAEPDENLLSTLLRSWEEHRRAISMIRDIVMYMDRTYVSQHKLLPIYDTGLTIFRTVIINNSLVKEKFLRILLANVEKERKGQLIDHLTMKGILSMLVELSINGEKVYENEFESIFLFQSRVFYSNESQECLHQQSYSCIEYLTKVNQRYQQEEARLRNYLSKTTELKLLNILDVELLSNHAEALVHMERSGCQVMLHENNIVHLKQLCQLFMTRVPLKVQLIRDCMSQYIKRVGYEILADQEKTKEKPVMFVENILALKDKFDHIIQICLQVRERPFLLSLYLTLSLLLPQNDQKSLRVLKESFEEFMNKDNRTAAFLALFVDDLMKSGSKEMTESEAEEKLDKVSSSTSLLPFLTSPSSPVRSL
jgi:cullin 3